MRVKPAWGKRQSIRLRDVTMLAFISPHYIILLLSACLWADAEGAEYNSTTPELKAMKYVQENYAKVWTDKGGYSQYDFACWEAVRPAAGWFVLGHYGQGNYDLPNSPLYLFKDEGGLALRMPFGWEFVWDDRMSIMNQDGSVWRVNCGPGYVALGDFFYASNRVDSPGTDLYYKAHCVREDLTEECDSPTWVWDDTRSFASKDVSVWATRGRNDNVLSGFLYANGEHDKQPPITKYCLKNSAFTIIN